MKLSQKLLFTLVFSLVIQFLVQSHSINGLAVAIGGFTALFLTTLGLTLLLTGADYFFYYITKKKDKFPEKRIFIICLILVSLFQIIISMNMGSST